MDTDIPDTDDFDPLAPHMGKKKKKKRMTEDKLPPLPRPQMPVVQIIFAGGKDHDGDFAT